MNVKAMYRVVLGVCIFSALAVSLAHAAINDGLPGDEKMAVTPPSVSAPDEMEKVFTDNPERFSNEMIAAYRERRIIVGMDPYLAQMAGGAFQYRVDADHKWPSDTDPLRIIYAQAMHPDDSKIWMMFANATQYPALGLVPFKVTVDHGTVVNIEKIATDKVSH